MARVASLSTRKWTWAGTSVAIGLAVAATAVMLARAPAAAAHDNRDNRDNRAHPHAGHDIATVARAELPPEAGRTLQLIHKGGPFPYSKDGTIFSNRERILPAQSRGYYREYTVKTPGSRDRGARRIICGGGGAAECYYTSDHYASFRLIKD